MRNDKRAAVRLPMPLVKKIEQQAKAYGSTLSQFLRTAAIEKLNRERRRVA